MNQKMRGMRSRAGRARAVANRDPKTHGAGEWHYDHTVIVRRSPEAVYAILADQQNYGDHSPGSLVPVLKKIPPDEPTHVGTRWHEVVRLAPFLTMTLHSTVTDVQPPDRLGMEWSGPWMHGRLLYTFEACPEGTRFRQQETFVTDGPLRLLDGMLRRSLFKRVAARQLDIRDLAER